MPRILEPTPSLDLESETARFLTAWMKVRQLVQAANFNRFHQAGLSATQFMTLNVIPSAGMTLSELARRLNLSPATLNATVNSLEQRGLVNRTPHAEDGRKLIICATPAGQTMQNSASSDFHQFISGLFRRMSHTRREGLLSGLEQLVELSSHSPQDEPSTRHADDAAPAKRSSRRSLKP